MDKLEKALEKARQQRATVAPAAPTHPTSARPASTFDAGESAHGGKTHSRTVKLDDEVLQKNRIVAHLPRNSDADIFKLLRTQTLQAMQKHGYKSLAITSPGSGDGKTTTALNLAISIALDLKQTVLLADLDLRKPCLHTYLGLEPTSGVSDHLAHKVPLSDCLIRLPFERLVFLPAGQALDRSSETLASPQMATLSKELKTRYHDRIVIYDMPPLLTQDDPLAFLPYVDAVLLVLKDGETREDDVKRCMDILSHANVIGTVLNAPSFSILGKEKPRQHIEATPSSQTP